MISWIWPPLHQLSSNGQFHRFGSPINAAWLGANFMNFATHNCLLVANFMDLAPNNFFLVANFMAFSWPIPFGPQQLLPGGQFHGFLMANSVWSQTATRCKFHGIGPPQLLSGGQFHAPTTASCVPISWIWPPNLSFGQKFYGLSPHSLYYLQLQF